MQDKHISESGRSMVEVLAVVAIIGVLSVGGMALSEHIIDRIKANRIVSGLQERIVLAMKRRTIGKSTTFRDRQIQESILGLYPVSYEKGFSDNTIPIYFGKKITVSGLSQEVCEALKEDEILLDTLNEINGVVSFNDGGEDGSCIEGDNNFFVLFGGRNEGKCYGRGNKCLECDKETGDWVVDESMNGQQVQDSCHICSDGRIVAKDKGRIKPCGSNCCSAFETCSSDLECVTHCPANSSTSFVAGNQIGDSDCYCFEDYRVDAFQTGCRSEKVCNTPCESPLICQDGECVCPNEDDEYVPSATNKANMLCCDSDLVMNGACCSSVTYDETTGEKLCCGYNSASAGCCPEGHFAYNNKCYSCEDETAVYVVQKQYCAMCPNRTQAAHRCRLKCPEDDQTEQNGVCYCPDDRPVQDNDGKCHTCDSGKKGVWNATLSAINLGYFSKISDVCASAAYCGNYSCTGGYMYACTEGQIGAIWAKPANNFKLKDGTQPGNNNSSAIKCYDCSAVDISTIKFQSQCNICGGTWSGENWFTGTCTPPPEPCTDEECSSENECMRCNPETNSCENKCQSVEYLEATGAQWMDTGITITATDNFTANYVVTLEKRSTRGLIGYSPASSGYWGITATNKYELGGSGTILTGERDSVVFERMIDSTGAQTHKLYVNGTLAGNKTRATAETGKFSLWAIANGSYKVSGKIYSFQMTLNGENVRNFVPVLDPDGIPAMFDQISKTLYYNSGTGSFKTNLD